MIKNIIFDWSGTLSDDFEMVYEAAMIIFKEFGAERISLDKFRKEFVLPYMNFYEKYVSDMSKEDEERIFLESIKSVKTPKLYPGAKETLEYLSKKGFSMAVLSIAPQELIDRGIKDYELSDTFVRVKGSIHDKREVIMELINECCFNEGETAFVGDMAHDIITGKKAGVTTIAITWGYQSREKLLKENPDHVINSISELKKLLNP